MEDLCRESRQWDVSNVSLDSIAKGFLLGFGDDNPFFGNENSKSRMKVRVGHQCFFTILILSSPRAKGAGPKGMRAESARAVTVQ